MEAKPYRSSIARVTRCDQNAKLLEARKIDGGEQFSRANDFGFLKP
jgi:hypothetical protein